MALGQPAAAPQLHVLLSLLTQFVEENDDPRASPHLRATGADRLEHVAALLARADVTSSSPTTSLLLLKAIKILARRQDVRQCCSQPVLEELASLLSQAAPASNSSTASSQLAQSPVALASEAANALSNLCYEPANCTGLLQAGGVPCLLQMLKVESFSVDAQANAASALQTLSFQPDARRAVVKAGGPARLLAALPRQPATASTSAAEARLQQRLVGALHNLSSGADGIAAIRRHPGGISALVSLLPCRQPGVAAAAAGALHNLCREEQARLDIRSHPDALPGLAAVLTGSDTQVPLCRCATLLTQQLASAATRMTALMQRKVRSPSTRPLLQAAVCAAGTLANLAGDAARSMQALLAAALAGGAVCHSCGSVSG